MTQQEPAPPASNKYCIIGAGPSGLAMARALGEVNVPYDHYERHCDVGGLWDMANPGSPIYESAHFISSRSMSAFPGFPMPEDYPDYPRQDQILDYLKRFAEAYGLRERIHFGQAVERVVPEPGSVQVTVNGDVRHYRGVVCASGVNWEPVLPELEGEFSGEQKHVIDYCRGEELSGKRVLIVGLGNSGADIACDAARFAKSTTISVRRGYHFIPKHIFGKPADVFAAEGPHLPLWLEQHLFGLIQRLLVGDTTRLGMPKPDHKILQSHPLMNDQLLHHLTHGDASLKPDVRRLNGKSVEFVDGTQQEFDLLLFATGYTKRIPYLDAKYLEPGSSWAAGNFLTCFNRHLDSLFTLGYAEINGALYPHLGRLAALIAKIAHSQLQDDGEWKAFYAWASKTQFDLTGGRQLIHTQRHSHYCDEHALSQSTLRAFRKMGWRAP